jgi:hypothetical protein
MNSKILLLTVAVAAVGLFAMPNSLSLFAGQHTFDKGADVKCEKCHQDIYDEMNNNGLYGNSTAHTAPNLRACTGCHKTGDISGIPVGKNSNGIGYNYSGTFSQNVGEKGAHAAVTMECTGCHTGVPTELLNINEAHGSFYNESITNSTSPSGKNNGTILKGANEACVGCHTHTNVNGTWRRSVGMDLLVYENTTGAYRISITANNSYNTTRTQGGNVTADGTNT